MKDNVFDKCKSLPDIIMLRDKLIKSGEDASAVNRLASMAKLRLAEIPDDVEWLDQVRPTIMSNGSKYTHLGIQPKDLMQSKVMTIHGNGLIEF